MQPYFYPYMGYFHLLAAADLFVVFDCVQFPRRGRVHRTEVPDGRGGLAWLTLPLARQPRDIRIDRLAFAPHARATLDGRLQALSWDISRIAPPDPVREALAAPTQRTIDFIERNLLAVAEAIGVSVEITRSSSLAVPPDIKGAERVRTIARLLGADRYLNASGGRGLYDAAFFREGGLELEFLAPYEGPYRSMLHDLCTAPIGALCEDAATYRIEAA